MTTITVFQNGSIEQSALYVLLPPETGSCTCLSSIAAALPKNATILSFYHLTYGRPTNDKNHNLSVPQLAARYLKTLSGFIDGSEPSLTLIGASTGGVVALELARLLLEKQQFLVRKNDTKLSMVLLDSPLPEDSFPSWNSLPSSSTLALDDEQRGKACSSSGSSDDASDSGSSNSLSCKEKPHSGNSLFEAQNGIALDPASTAVSIECAHTFQDYRLPTEARIDIPAIYVQSSQRAATEAEDSGEYTYEESSLTSADDVNQTRRSKSTNEQRQWQACLPQLRWKVIDASHENICLETQNAKWVVETMLDVFV